MFITGTHFLAWDSNEYAVQQVHSEYQDTMSRSGIFKGSNYLVENRLNLFGIHDRHISDEYKAKKSHVET